MVGALHRNVSAWVELRDRAEMLAMAVQGVDVASSSSWFETAALVVVAVEGSP